LSGERGVEISRLAQNYGRLEDGFIELLKIDQKERSESDQIKAIDKAKHTLTVCNYLFLRRLIIDFHATTMNSTIFRADTQNWTEQN
jgi:hypothetical protein